MNQRIARAVGLFCFLMAVYFCTYNGRPVSGDEQIMFDGAHSYYRDGSLELGYFNGLRPYFPAPASRPVLSMDVEPLQSYAAALLIWLAAQFPRIGLVHAAWSLNLWVTALTAVALYDFGLLLGYRDRTALIVALLFGTATMAWPYSALFFREPLFTLLALLCTDCLTRWQKLAGKRRRLIWLAAAGSAFAGALLTKGTALLLIPALVILVAPLTRSRRTLRRLLLACILILAIAGGLFIVYQWVAPGVRYRFASIWLTQIDLSYVSVAVPAWLVSPGFSLWVFSPVLLIGVAGVNWLARRQRFREIMFPLTIALSFILGYAILQSNGWYSGLGWGPRYLLPLTPFLCLWLLPVIENYAARRRVGLLIGGLAAFSVAVQLLAVYVPIDAFSAYLNAQSLSLGRLILPWQDGVWTLAYSPIAVNLRQVASVPSQIAWMVTHSGDVILPLCLMAAGISLLAMIQRNRLLALLALATVLSTVYIGLSSFYDDPRFGGDNPVLWQVLDRLNTELRPGDAILLNDESYRGFFANYYKGHAPIYVLPDAPGERSTPDRLPDVVTDNLDAQVNPYTWTLVSRLARTSSRWWFVTEFTPFSRNRVRPNEHFLARNFFPVREVINTNIMRLIEFAPVSASPDQIDPVNPLDINFGAAHLLGFDLPRGSEFTPGARVPISLLWQQQSWPADLSPFDYSVNVSLINAQGLTIVQQTGTPDGSFGMMSTWQTGKRYRDNHALALPATLAPGSYNIWISLYDWRNSKNLPVRNAGIAIDHAIVGRIIVLSQSRAEFSASRIKSNG